MNNHTGTDAHYERLIANALREFAHLTRNNLANFYEAGECHLWHCSEAGTHAWLAVPCDAEKFVLRRPGVGAHAISADGAGLTCSIITTAEILMHSEGTTREQFVAKQMEELLGLLESHPESKIIRKLTGLAA